MENKQNLSKKVSMYYWKEKVGKRSSFKFVSSRNPCLQL